MDYVPRVLDAHLDEMMVSLPAITVDGAKGVGKTATARRCASSEVCLDDPDQAALLAADPGRLERLERPVLVDEWQRYPRVWDLVRRSVDSDSSAGRFLLTGSASPSDAPVHSGAGRIVQLRMRPMSLAERGLVDCTVSLAEMLGDDQADVSGECPIGVEIYAQEIVRSGFPGIRGLTFDGVYDMLEGYVARIVERDFPEQGHPVRRPSALRSWLTAYAAATSTTASYNAILDAATPGHSDKPAKTTVSAYRDVLAQLWVLDPLPGWSPTRNHFARLAKAPKHHLCDPALAAHLLGVDSDALLYQPYGGPPIPRDGPLLGALFESLVTLSLRVYAQRSRVAVAHLRTQRGDREVDLILVRRDGRVVALQVKLASSVTDEDVKHLLWLREQLGDDLLDAAVITSGRAAYRRTDGIAVVPAALLGP